MFFENQFLAFEFNKLFKNLQLKKEFIQPMRLFQVFGSKLCKVDSQLE